jgi:hypothetical protein
MTMTTIPAVVLCRAKRPLSQEEAERIAAGHYACRTCADGSRKLQAYVCPADPSHHHVGHLGVRR